VGRLESIKLFLPSCEAEYFCWRYWTGFSSARPSGKSAGYPDNGQRKMSGRIVSGNAMMWQW
jgi:hypothetical protein